MSATEWVAARERERLLERYNYAHFRTGRFLADLFRSIRGEGVQPGQEAPDFDLETTEGTRVRLSELRGRPVVLRFVSIT